MVRRSFRMATGGMLAMLAAILALVLTPAQALAYYEACFVSTTDGAAGEYSQQINDGVIWDGYRHAASGEGWSWDGAGTLTLSGYHGGAISLMAWEEESPYFKLVLQGSNSITLTEPLNSYELSGSGGTFTWHQYCGIEGFGTLDIVGPGTLDINLNPARSTGDDTYHGIEKNGVGDLSISNGATVNITGRGISTENMGLCGTSLYRGNIVIDNATLAVRGNNVFDANDMVMQLTIRNGSKVIVEGQRHSGWSYDSSGGIGAREVSISDSTVNVKGVYAGVYATENYNPDEGGSPGRLSIANSTLNIDVAGIALHGKTIHIEREKEGYGFEPDPWDAAFVVSPSGSINKVSMVPGAKTSDWPSVDGTAPVYRLYNRKTSEHLYTINYGEFRDLPKITKGDWVQEGIAWYAPKTSKTPVYRLYNKKSGDHHYTTSKQEADTLVKKHGWTLETTAFYSDDAKRVPLYRLYNGRLQRGQHHYTADSNERNVLSSKHGWKYETIGFYGVKAK